MNNLATVLSYRDKIDAVEELLWKVCQWLVVQLGKHGNEREKA
jgi:hypothetical protein